MKSIQSFLFATVLLFGFLFSNHLSAQTTYKFKGGTDINWSNVANWENGKKPPAELAAGSNDIIIIDHGLVKLDEDFTMKGGTLKVEGYGALRVTKKFVLDGGNLKLVGNGHLTEWFQGGEIHFIKGGLDVENIQSQMMLDFQDIHFFGYKWHKTY
ncbi:MAG: hypothetical protein AAF587_26040 [Bacteroidota bacterium]